MSSDRKAGSMKIVLVVVLCLLIVGLGAGAYMVFSSGILGQEEDIAQASQQGPQQTPGQEQTPVNTPPVGKKIVQGVTISGLLVGGLEVEEAQALINENESKLLSNIKVSFKVKDKQLDYTAADIGVGLDAEATLSNPALYQQGAPATDYKAVYKLDAAAARDKLTADTASLNTAPIDAKVEFTPNEAEKFKYTPEADGQSVKIDELVSMIDTKIKEGTFDVFDAPLETAPAALKLADLQTATAPIIHTFNSDAKKWEPGFTSYFKKSNESGANRVFNINKLSGIVNGTVIQPGETFSLNKKAGARTVKNGWKKAHGIVDGRYEDQPGGGVCQVSGTLYNAAIRAGLEIVERQHHSWPSTYLPKGLDATISTGGPDLKIKNPYDMPIYITAVCDTKKKYLTINIYGKPFLQGQYLDFTSKKTGSIAQPKEKIIKSDKDLEGDPLAPGKKKVYPGHTGQIWKVYKQIKDEQGNVLKTEELYTDRYAAFGKRTVINPAPVPTPTPSPSPSPSAPPTPSPSEAPAA